jgi:hypothetical protein
MKHRRQTAAAAILLGMVSTQVHADVRYDFTALTSIPVDGHIYTGSFSFLAPDFITAYTEVLPPAMLNCWSSPSPGIAGCVGAILDTRLSGNDAIEFRVRAVTPNIEWIGLYYYFADGALSRPGSYTSVLPGAQQSGQLVVTATSAVPELPMSSLLIPGLLALTTMVRRNGPALRQRSHAGQPRRCPNLHRHRLQLLTGCGQFMLRLGEKQSRNPWSVRQGS